jgi:hypothetical protein
MMNSAQVRQLARAHGQAGVASDTKKIMVDVVSELHDQIPQLASALPQPLTAARVLSVDVFDDHAETLTEYTGRDRRSRSRRAGKTAARAVPRSWRPHRPD